MDKYYLFGAGNNVWGVISYFGNENIIAIIDNEKKRVGYQIKGIPVISFDEYLERHGDEIIIITAAIYDEIARQLEQYGIYNYYVSPMIQFGLSNTEQMIKDWNLVSKKQLVLYGYNPISIKLVKHLKDYNKDIKIKVLTNNISEIKNADRNEVEIISLYQLEKGDTVIVLSKDSCNDLYSNPSLKLNILNIFELKISSNQTIGRELKKYKDVHSGESCIVVGNGPSIRIEDLEHIQNRGIYNFGMNLAYKIYDKTSWRPTYFMLAEYNLLRQYYDEIKELEHNNMFIKNFYYMDDTPYILGANYYPGCPERCYLEEQKFTEDISEVVYSGYSVMYDTIQIAVYMGFTKIYLIGADFNYLGDAAKKGNHFYDSTFEDIRNVAGVSYTDIALTALSKAKEFADSHGIEIYNATRGGKLEVFPRVELDLLLHMKERKFNEM